MREQFIEQEALLVSYAYTFERIEAALESVSDIAASLVGSPGPKKEAALSAQRILVRAFNIAQTRQTLSDVLGASNV